VSGAARLAGKAAKREQAEVWIGDHQQELVGYLARTDPQSMRRILPTTFGQLRSAVGRRRFHLVRGPF
jgi:hypothetical protein